MVLPLLRLSVAAVELESQSAHHQDLYEIFTKILTNFLILFKFDFTTNMLYNMPAILYGGQQFGFPSCPITPADYSDFLSANLFCPSGAIVSAYEFVNLALYNNGCNVPKNFYKKVSF